MRRGVRPCNREGAKSAKKAEKDLTTETPRHREEGEGEESFTAEDAEGAEQGAEGGDKTRGIRRWRRFGKAQSKTGMWTG